MSSERTSDSEKSDFGDREALAFHRMGRPGKIDIIASKPMATQRDLPPGLFARRRRAGARHRRRSGCRL